MKAIQPVKHRRYRGDCDKGQTAIFQIAGTIHTGTILHTYGHHSAIVVAPWGEQLLMPAKEFAVQVIIK